jgi:hypothetical protein
VRLGFAGLLISIGTLVVCLIVVVAYLVLAEVGKLVAIHFDRSAV